MRSNAENLPFKNKSFDKIVTTEVIEHILHPMALLEELERVSKNDTVVIITIPNEMCINWIKNILFTLGLHKLLFRKSYRPSKRMEDEWHLHTFDINKFKELIEGKFIIEKTIPIPIVLFPLRFVFRLKGVSGSLMQRHLQD